ncbi:MULTISPECIES: aquaporin [Microbacterium]|uniref:aquaporin n=1 Tax=Microbacterium TaxID=33882 RepID=UPI00217D1F9D|nr:MULTISPECIES: aquaporin [Microbacterium]UWF78203.1 aquaporin [Microbacterium neungamense]WCM56375.1 aquaporin [Microbacterium sp. EF45047]
MSDSPTSTSTAVSTPTLGARLAAEGFGALLLVFGGVGTALFASSRFTEPGSTATVYLAVAVAFGLALIVGLYAFGPVSGGHFNPAVTLGMAAAGRFPWRDVGPYAVAQLVGSVVGTTLLVLVGMFGPETWLAAAQDAGFASNGWDAQSPGGFGMLAAVVIELILTGLLLFVVLGTTHPERSTRFAGLVIGLALTVIHLVAIPVDGASVNPARSIATAIYGGMGPLSQLWVFLVFPVVGAMLAGYAYRALFDGRSPTGR